MAWTVEFFQQQTFSCQIKCQSTRVQPRVVKLRPGVTDFYNCNIKCKSKSLPSQFSWRQWTLGADKAGGILDFRDFSRISLETEVWVQYSVQQGSLPVCGSELEVRGQQGGPSKVQGHWGSTWLWTWEYFAKTWHSTFRLLSRRLGLILPSVLIWKLALWGKWWAVC